MKNNIVKDTISITLITLVAGLLLGLVHGVTAEPIAREQARQKEEAYMAVFEDASGFEAASEEQLKAVQEGILADGFATSTIDEVMIAQDESGQELGYAFTVTNSEGYGGNITFAMGIQDDGTLNGISILSISETAGLGMQATQPEFQQQCAGKQVESFEYTKSGASADNQIDALSGATITTNAMTNGVNAGLDAFRIAKGGN